MQQLSLTYTQLHKHSYKGPVAYGSELDAGQVDHVEGSQQVIGVLVNL